MVNTSAHPLFSSAGETVSRDVVKVGKSKRSAHTSEKNKWNIKKNNLSVGKIVTILYLRNIYEWYK